MPSEVSFPRDVQDAIGRADPHHPGCTTIPADHTRNVTHAAALAEQVLTTVRRAL